MDQPSPEQASARIEALLDQLASSTDPAVPEQVAELVQCVLALHAAGLSRLVAGLDAGALRELAADKTVESLLVLHDLHPVPLGARANEALGSISADLGEQGREVRLTGVDGQGIAHVQVGPGCGAVVSELAASLREAMLDAVPDLADVRVEQAAPGPAMVQLSPTRRRDREEPL